MNRMKPVFILFAVLALAASVLGQIDGSPENWCRGGFFAIGSDHKIGIVNGAKGEKVNFYNDLEEICPTSETCKDKAYVIPADKVVVSKTFKAFGCAWYTSAKGTPTVGWIKLEKLRILPAGQLPRLNDWLGRWEYADNSIRFARERHRGNLRVTGNAFWKGLGDNIHIGEIDSVCRPKGNLLKIGESDTDKYSCKVTIRLIENFLVVSDNMNCGGANVTFSGVYRRKN